MPWTNPDGLTIYFDGEEAQLANGGEYKTFDLSRVEDVEVDLTTLTTTAAVVSRSVFPWGKTLDKVEIIADVAATSGGSATLDVGFRRVTAGTDVDDDGAVAALPLANINVTGETNVLTAGVTYAGALVGTVVEADESCYITASYNTAAFTAGRIRIRLFWSKKTSTT